MTAPVPRLSIVTAVFNGRRTIEQTIRSVLDQGYPSLDYLVVDGGSTDGTLDILRRYEGSLRWISRPDKGMYHAMNDGIGRTIGELVGIINSDDWYEPGAFERVVREFAGSDRETILYGITRYHGANGVDMILSYDHSTLPQRMINHPACFVPRTIYFREGNFDTRFAVAADYDFLLRAYTRGVRFRHVEAILANFRHGGFSAHHASASEVLRIRYRHGHLTRAQFLRGHAVRLAKAALSPIAR
jgi:glycosyltransferase involved in cell wall biosynthesis